VKAAFSPNLPLALSSVTDYHGVSVEALVQTIRGDVDVLVVLGDFERIGQCRELRVGLRSPFMRPESSEKMPMSRSQADPAKDGMKRST
jgi:hypothetical protein